MNFLYKYSTFEDTKELNYHVKQHVNKHYYDMTKTERGVLYAIAQYAVVKDGACKLRVITLAKALDKTERTIYRALNTLIELGIIDRINTTREKSGGQGANIYRILPYVIPEMSDGEEVAKPTQASDEPIENETETINLLSYSSNTYDSIDAHNNDKQSQVTAEQVIHESIANNTPKPIVELLSPFFYGSELYKYVGIIFKAKYRPFVNLRIEEHLSDFKACIYDVIRRHKAGHVRNLEAYLYKSIQALSRRLFMQQAESDAI